MPFACNLVRRLTKKKKRSTTELMIGAANHRVICAANIFTPQIDILLVLYCLFVYFSLIYVVGWAQCKCRKRSKLIRMDGPLIQPPQNHLRNVMMIGLDWFGLNCNVVQCGVVWCSYKHNTFAVAVINCFNLSF